MRTFRRAVEAGEGAAQLLGALVASPFRRTAHRTWGSTSEERDAVFPGDDLLPSPCRVSTRALTVDAPPQSVWPWLAQVGQGRGGLYSFDVLENLARCDIHTAEVILPQHQHLEAGDLIRMGAPAGYPCYRVVMVEEPQALVLVGADPHTTQAVSMPPAPGTGGATWQWSLRPIDGGRRTRLVTRHRLACPAGQRILWRLIEPVEFVMERRMLRTLKAKAERSSPQTATAPAPSHS